MDWKAEPNQFRSDIPKTAWNIFDDTENGPMHICWTDKKEDAHLIAAAPRLLIACEKLMDFSIGPKGCRMGDEQWQIIEIASAAIDRAKNAS